MEAMRQLVCASTLAERGSPSMAAYSPKMITGPQIAKTDGLAGERVDRHADLAGGDEEYVVRGIEIADDWLALRVVPP
jgi:hypothetical protein